MVYRALDFIYIFLDSVLSEEQDLVKCAHRAYDESLRRYHGWIVRGIFSVRSYSKTHAISFYGWIVINLMAVPKVFWQDQATVTCSTACS